MQRRIVSVPVLALFVLGITAGCAQTLKGKVQQSGKVLIEVEKAVKEACRDSKAQGWTKPFTKDVCVKASIAYDGAWEATKAAVRVIDQGGQVGFDTVVLVGKFVLDMVKLLREAGLPIPGSAIAFVQKDVSAVLVR